MLWRSRPDVILAIAHPRELACRRELLVVGGALIGKIQFAGYVQRENIASTGPLPDHAVGALLERPGSDRFEVGPATCDRHRQSCANAAKSIACFGECESARTPLSAAMPPQSCLMDRPLPIQSLDDELQAGVLHRACAAGQASWWHVRCRR